MSFHFGEDMTPHLPEASSLKKSVKGAQQKTLVFCDWLLPSLKLTFSHLKMDGWNTKLVSFWDAIFSSAKMLLVSGRGPCKGYFRDTDFEFDTHVLPLKTGRFAGVQWCAKRTCAFFFFPKKKRNHQKKSLQLSNPWWCINFFQVYQVEPVRLFSRTGYHRSPPHFFHITVFPKIGGTPKWMAYKGKPY